MTGLPTLLATPPAAVARGGAELFLDGSLLAAGLMLGISILLIAIRLLRGPSLPDRVIALDLLGTIAAGAVGIFAIEREEPVILYVAILLALLLFVGTVAFAFYLERGAAARASATGPTEEAP
ncbi:MAG: monovalent cation/H+ antiporter complex subunit F [Phycisphaerales bacterium]|jgi:multicomponent Na+:H+ antiporter subunit F